MTDISPLATKHDPVIWRGMRRSELDRAYDNTSAVRESADYLASWLRRSRALKVRQPELIDLVYGPRERNRIDIFRSGTTNAPLVVFIHGGYWQRNSKDIFSCMAEGPLSAGVDVAFPGYTLAPNATLGEIITEIHAAVRWLRREGPALGVAAGRLIVSGWSAGGHLAATTMTMPEVDAGLFISGIFDLEPIRLGVLNDKLRLRDAEVEMYSPQQNLPAKSCELAVVFGSNELPELQRQSKEFAASCDGAGCTVQLAPISGANHFLILEELAVPGGEILNILRSLAFPD